MLSKRSAALVAAVIMCLMLCGCTRPTGISLSNATLKLKVGETASLKAHVDTTGSIGSAPEMDLKWSSSDDNVALVNSEGDVTANHAGNCNIICIGGNFEASCTVTVEDENVSVSGNDNSGNGGGTTIINNYYNSYNDQYGAHFEPDYEFRASDFVFPESSVRKLSKSEIEDVLWNMSGNPITDSFAQDAINEIYARNGYVFRKDMNAKAYYESRSWYYPDYDFSTSDFNSVERYNIDLLSGYR